MSTGEKRIEHKKIRGVQIFQNKSKNNNKI